MAAAAIYTLAGIICLAGVLLSCFSLSGTWLVLAATGLMTWSRWPELLGASLLVVLWVVLCTSLWVKFLELSYRGWWRIHQLVFAAVLMVVIHGLAVGSDLAGGWPRA